MISAAELMKRMGLVPFFKCVCVYFAAGAGAGAEGGAAPSLTAVAAKCAPVLCLLLIVALHHGSTIHPKGRYARRICLGLSLSALGDALLVWPQYFVAGMAAFALAHLAYLAAFRARGAPAAPAPGLGAALYAATALYLQTVSPPGSLRLLVPLYSLLLATMTWRALALALPCPALSAAAGADPARRASLAAAAGAVLFLISDAVLGYSLFGGPVPYKQVVVMSTYYLGQLGIALSALAPWQRTTH